MTTMHIQDISHKKKVAAKFTPNSYRIFCEETDNESLPPNVKYSSQAPNLYTQPMVVPAQAIEDRNNPHAGRAATFLRENAHTLNDPINRISSKNVPAEADKRWWQWDPVEEKSQHKRSQSLSGKKNQNEGYQTTYQKELSYLNDPNNESLIAARRHSRNPHNAAAVGIVPINDLTGFSKPDEAQRVFVDRVSFEQAYDSRNENNYPMRARRHGAFVLEQVEPKPILGTQARPDSNKSASVWDVMHPQANSIGQTPKNTQLYQKQAYIKPDILQNQRRDPIGYFEETKFAGNTGSNLYTNNYENYPNERQNNNSNTSYQPSWSNINSSVTNLKQSDMNEANDLLDSAMRPIMANGYQN